VQRFNISATLPRLVAEERRVCWGFMSIPTQPTFQGISS
jgi:hypothetical protein